MARIPFMNTEIDNLTMAETLDAVDRLVGENRNAYIVSPNVDSLVKLEQGGELAEAFRQAELILTDGKPMIWISRWYGTPIKEKLSGSDLFPRICELAGRRGYRMFFLGAAEGVAAEAAKRLTEQFPGLNVVGVYSPPFGFEKDEAELQKITRIVREAQPQILILGFGCPKQEVFILHHREALGVPVSLCVGAGLDFAAGRVKRAPKWMSDNGLEWLFRITQDPKRLAKRYFVDDSRIFRMALKYRPRK